MFQPTADNSTPINLGGARYSNSFTRVYTGDKSGTILTMSELPAKNIVLLNAASSWTEFGGSPGDHFVAALSGRFYPQVSGSFNFRWETLEEILPGPPVEDPASRVISTEELGSLVACLTTVLSELESEVLTCYLDGRSYEEIAERMACDTKTVDNALRRLNKFPDSKRRLPEFPDLPFREVVVPPYRFFYRVEQSTVWIVAVWPGAQQPDEP